MTRGGSVESEANRAPAILTLPRQKKSAFEALTTSGSTMAMPPWLQVGETPAVRAFLAQGPLRLGICVQFRAVPSPVQPGHD
nr:MAG TPA: hypothetical protein [Caudoviricetes sp.]